MSKWRTLRVLALGMALVPLAACVASRATLASNDVVGLEGSQCRAITGTRIRTKRSASGCRPSVAPLKSYTAEQLSSTGAIGLDDALRQIDLVFH